MRRVRARAGLTIIELLVAIILLSIGILGLSGVSMMVSKQHRGAADQEVAALVVQSRFDSLASVDCKFLASAGTQTGTSTTRGITEKWVITNGAPAGMSNVKLISDTVRFSGRKNPLVYSSVIPCRG